VSNLTRSIRSRALCVGCVYSLDMMLVVLHLEPIWSDRFNLEVRVGGGGMVKMVVLRESSLVKCGS
jgi:hypothetical protein